MKQPVIRFAQPRDLDQITEIYNYYVVNTAITFDTIPWTTKDRQAWLQQFEGNSRYACFIIEMDEKILGYTCSSKLRPKPAYDSSVETTIYLHQDAAGKGYGRILYQHLLTHLESQNLHRCYGIIALPNEASVALHESLGFKQVGVLTEVGLKFGKYWDTVWLEKPLDD